MKSIRILPCVLCQRQGSNFRPNPDFTLIGRFFCVSRGLIGDRGRSAGSAHGWGGPGKDLWPTTRSKGRAQIHAGDLSPALLPVNRARFKPLIQDPNDEIDLNPGLPPVVAAGVKLSAKS